MIDFKFRNGILQRLNDADLATFAPHLESVELKQRRTLIRANQFLDYVYFPERGQISMLVSRPQSSPIEVGLIGREGTTDMAAEGARTRSPYHLIVQASGVAWRLPADVYARALAESPALLMLAMRFQLTLQVQTSFTALSHGTDRLPARLARWLLMAQDRLESDEVPLVQEFLAYMLAVRRSGVTEVLGSLESEGSIKLSRGLITILQRAKLIELANGGYGVPEAEYERLIGSIPVNKAQCG